MQLLAWICLACVAAAVVDGGALLRIQMIHYKNGGSRDYKGECCDLWCINACDYRFFFCVDRAKGDNDHKHCQYSRDGTGEFPEKNDINFEVNMQGVPNPWETSIPKWPGTVLFKMYVEDSDSGFTAHDMVDRFVHRVSPAMYRAESLAAWKQETIRGMRAREKTSLTFRYMVYCEADYYSADCSVLCKAQDSATTGHYTCDPDTGDKVCRVGWEAPAEDCKIWADDCKVNNCSAGATCVDGDRSYTCTCPPGYRGANCEENIDECLSDPCEHNGTCVDLVNSYTCKCTPGYVGNNCSFHVCADASACQNGGTCISDGKCLCKNGFLGSRCDVSFCQMNPCQNGGTCNGTGCVCPLGFHGSRCDLDLCLILQCHNGGACHQGVCQCPAGFSGRFCEMNVKECASNPCSHDGTCIDGTDSFLCRCRPQYRGDLCQLKVQRNFTDEIESDAQSAERPTPPTTTYDPPVGASTKIVHTGFAPWLIAVIAVVAILAITIIIIVFLVLRHRREAQKMDHLQNADGSFDNPMSVMSVTDSSILTVSSLNGLVNQENHAVENPYLNGHLQNSYLRGNNTCVIDPPSYTEHPYDVPSLPAKKLPSDDPTSLYSRPPRPRPVVNNNTTPQDSAGGACGGIANPVYEEVRFKSDPNEDIDKQKAANAIAKSLNAQGGKKA